MFIDQTDTGILSWLAQTTEQNISHPGKSVAIDRGIFLDLKAAISRIRL